MTARKPGHLKIIRYSLEYYLCIEKCEEKFGNVCRVNSTDDFTTALLSKSPAQFAQSAQLLG
jgi:hypothetical protein